MAGQDLLGIDPVALATKYSLSTANTAQARSDNIGKLINAGYSHLQANYVSERAIQVANFSSSRTSHTSNVNSRPKPSPFTTDDEMQIQIDISLANSNSPTPWKAR